MPRSYLMDIVGYWSHEFNWREREAWLNTFPQFTAMIAGRRVHFLHVRSNRSGAMPLIVCHGWPYTFVDMLPLVPLLDDFDLVIPSLPGFTFSEAPQGHFTDETVASALHTLMVDVLGYSRYGTYGEDIGSSVSHQLAARYPETVAGLFATHPALPSAHNLDNLTRDEAAFLTWLDDEWKDERGYQSIQSTRPDTLAAALNDSPAGLAAWILEKFRSWSDRSDGEYTKTLDEKFARDDLLTTVSLYWFTQSIGSSFRSYYDFPHRADRPTVRVPAGIALGQGDLGYPRSLAERCYTDIRSFEALPRGGHFMAKEEPDAVASRLRNFFQTL